MLNEVDRKFVLDLANDIHIKFEHHRDIALKCVMQAWCEKQDLGYNAVVEKANELAEFASQCLWLLAGYSGNSQLFDGPKYHGEVQA